MKYILLFFLVLCGLPAAAQEVDSVLERSGFLIYINKGWIFKPCKNDTAALFNVAKDASFIPETRLERGHKRLPAGPMGTALPIRYRDQLTGSMRQDTIYYFYCTATFVFLHDTKFEENNCRYELRVGSKTVPLLCTRVENYVTTIKPKRSADRKAYVDCLIAARQPLPYWAERKAGSKARLMREVENAVIGIGL